MDIIIILLILSFLVLAHELGHYLAAKKLGVKVDEFGFGYPPRARMLFRKWGTTFTLNWLPFGGFVRLSGDDAEGETVEDRNSFGAQPKASRLVVILAGVAMNLLVGVAAFALIYTKIGVPARLDHPRIEVVAPSSPAEQAGVQVGDRVASVEGQSVGDANALVRFIEQMRGKEITVRLLRGTDFLEVRLRPRTAEETPHGEGSLGVALTETELRHYPWWQMPFRGMVYGVRDSYRFSVLILDSLRNMVEQLVSRGQVPQDVAGPIGIVDSVRRDRTFQRDGILAAINLAGLLSVNLAVINLLPIPALDGGRAMFVMLEALLGRYRRIVIERRANAIGMAMLLMLIILISIQDVIRIVRK